MSEVAVKIYETKRDIQRIQLVAPVDAKHPVGKFVNPDTGQPVTSVLLSRVGFYSLEWFASGKNIKNFRGPFDSSTSKTFISGKYYPTSSTRLVHRKSHFSRLPNHRVGVTTFSELGPETRIEQYYAIVRYLDD